MASAPRPGAGKRVAQVKAAQRVLKIRIGDIEGRLCPDNLPFSEQVAVRKACGGLPFSAFWAGEQVIGEDSLQIMFWLARRASGEPNLQLNKVLEEWPSPLMAEDFDISIEDAEEDADHPE
jgi:hypothetical protein